MPIQAAAFVVPASLLSKLGALAESEQIDAFWELLHKDARRVEPEFSHSGYVLAVLLEYLEEKGLHVVAAAPGPDAEKVEDASLGLQGCLTRAEAAEVLEALGAVQVAEGELLSYYEEFAEEPLARAGLAMMDGLDFLKTACRSIRSDEDRLLLFVG